MGSSGTGVNALGGNCTVMSAVWQSPLTWRTMRALRFLILSALFICVGLPLLFVLFVMGMATFGIVFGLGMAAVGMLLGLVKIALMVIVPIAIVAWLFNLMTHRDRAH